MRAPLRILGVTVAVSLAAAAVPLLVSTDAQAVKFTGGNLVVYRVGSGTGALTNAAAPVFLDEYTSTGTQGVLAGPADDRQGRQPGADRCRASPARRV